MIPPAPPLLTGSWIRLEPLSRRHVPGLLEVALDPELWRWTTSNVGSSGDLERWVEEALRAQEQGRALPFVTVERSGGRIVGSTRFGSIERAHRRMEIGWTWVARPWQRSPVNTEAKLLMLEWGFEVAGCLRIELKTDVLNTRSREAIQRLGAVQEGILRSHIITETGRIRDTVYYSILASEWPRVRRHLTERLARSSA